MSGRRIRRAATARDEDPAATRRVRDLLRAEAERHHPDRDRVLAAVRREQASTTPKPPARTDPGGRARPRIRPLGLVAAAAAVVISVAGVAYAVSSPPDTPTPDAVTLSEAASGLAPAQEGRSSTGSTSPGAEHARGPSADSTPGTSVSGSPTAAAGPGTGPAASITGSVLGAAASITVPTAGDTDWLVLGARQDGVVVRAKNGSGAIAVPTVRGGAARPAPGPFQVSWQGGSPEQDHVAARTWLQVPTTGSWQSRIALSGPSVVEVYLGTVDAHGVLKVARTGAIPVSAPLPGGSGTTAASVRVEVPTARPGDVLVLDLTGTGDGNLGVSALELRPLP